MLRWKMQQRHSTTKYCTDITLTTARYAQIDEIQIKTVSHHYRYYRHQGMSMRIGACRDMSPSIGPAEAARAEGDPTDENDALLASCGLALALAVDGA
jgi:hypothetical protein